MERGRLVEWLVKPGQRVTRGDIIAVIETQKGAIEVEIWTTGTVSELLVEEDTEADVGTVLARIDEGQAAASPTAVPGKASVVEAVPKPTHAAPAFPRPVAPVPIHLVTVGDASRVLASPWARHLAAERGVDLASLSGSGPGGAIVGADIPDTTPQPKRRKPRTNANADAMRQAVARAMAKSKREIPHYSLGTDIDMTRALTWLEQTNATVPPPQRLLPAVLLLKASALAARKIPEINGFYRNGGLEVSDSVHLGVAVSLRGGGLVAPALHDTDKLPLPDLMRALTDLVARARRGRLRGSEMTDATLTVTSMGERGVSRVTGIIYPPQVAIVGFGKIEERPWVVDGAVVPRRMVSASLAGDHRAHDGHLGGLYLAALDALLQNPEAL
jgi:pyruvate dehydrogenase E2 component (dihydrolipoamide acetyltransferase)